VNRSPSSERVFSSTMITRFHGGYIRDLLVRVRVRWIRFEQPGIVHVDHGDHDIYCCEQGIGFVLADTKGVISDRFKCPMMVPSMLTNGCYDSMIARIGFDFLF